VLRRAAELAVELNTGRPRPLRVSVNVSTRQFALDDVAEATRSVLETTGCDPRWLILEITENLLLDELPRVDRTLDSLRSLGVSIAIDDFGTGYSSLHYLTRLRVDHMKVDKSFVRDADVDHQQQEIVRALVAMAQALGIGVVAEGIETPGQACLLEQLGCRLGQGYLLARPMPIEQFTSWLTDAHATLRATLPA
jgi:EAL domain-containing protein (putative c-di-GMP-specific phosphodiesterase class I)